MKEIFHEEFPKYLAMGMSYEEYWHGDANLPKDYVKANLLKRSQRNEEMWRQGLYIYNAMAAVSPLFRDWPKAKPQEYMEYPIPLTREDREAIENDKNRRRYQLEIQKMKDRAKAFNTLFEGRENNE